MRKFNVGDRVKVVSDDVGGGMYVGQTGVITIDDGPNAFLRFSVNILGKDVCFDESEIELIDPPTVIEGVVEIRDCDEGYPGVYVGEYRLDLELEDGEHVRITIERIRKEGE